MAGDDSREMLIPPRELGDAVGEGVLGQLHGHVHLTLHARAS
jgi:hypothetical protein